jgi:hypothetical protein
MRKQKTPTARTEAERLSIDIRDDVVVRGDVPLHHAIEWTDGRLAQMWRELSTPMRVQLLIALRLHEELAMRMAHRIILDCHPAHAQECADAVAKLEQERSAPGWADLPSLRHRLMVSSIFARITSLLKEVSWVLDPMHRISGAPIGDRGHAFQMMWSFFNRALNSDTLAVYPIVASMGPPTIKQIVEAAQVWGRPTVLR